MQEIDRILEHYDALKAAGTPAALATVVHVEQSSYRRIGARLLVAADGTYVGGISGGCLEGDALKRARLTIHDGRPRSQVYDTTDGEDQVIGIGLGCEGRIEVLFLPLDYDDPENEVELLRSVPHRRHPSQLLRFLDEAPGIPRGRVLTADPARKIEELTGTPAIWTSEKMAAILATGRSKVIELPTGQRLLCEVLQPRMHLVLTGYNYDIPATLQQARTLGWRTTVVAPRRKLTRQITSLADRTLDYSEVHQVSLDAATAVALMSHDYDWDREMVRHFLPRRPAYFGMLGPRKRMLKMHDEVAAGGIDLAGYPQLHSPVGLDIGATGPEEIAVSLCAEILAVFRGRDGRYLRQRVGTIHA